MKRLLTILLLCIALSLSVSATGWDSIHDNAELIGEENQIYLQEEIDRIADAYDYHITLVSGEVEYSEDFVEIEALAKSYDPHDEGAVLAVGIYENGYCYTYIIGGDGAEELTEQFNEEMAEIDATTDSYAAFYQGFIFMVEDLLLENPPTVTPEQTPEPTPTPTLTPEENAVFISGFEALIDNGGLLTKVEELTILSRIQQIHKTYDFDVTILTMNDVPNGNELDTYLHYYEGIDPTRNGVVFGVNMDLPNDGENRGQYTSIRNDAIEIFSEDALDTLNRELPEPLADGDYAEAMNIYLDCVTTFLEVAQTGEVYSAPLIANSGAWSSALILAFLLAMLIVKVFFVAPMKTAVKQTSAGAFMEEGSLNLRVEQDTYTHTTVQRTLRKEDKDDDNDGGAHSSGYGGSRGGGGSGF